MTLLPFAMMPIAVKCSNLVAFAVFLLLFSYHGDGYARLSHRRRFFNIAPINQHRGLSLHPRMHLYSPEPTRKGTATEGDLRQGPTITKSVKSAQPTIAKVSSTVAQRQIIASHLNDMYTAVQVRQSPTDVTIVLRRLVDYNIKAALGQGEQVSGQELVHAAGIVGEILPRLNFDHIR
jgi:hypothetical protein